MKTETETLGGIKSVTWRLGITANGKTNRRCNENIAFENYVDNTAVKVSRPPNNLICEFVLHKGKHVSSAMRESIESLA